MFKSRENALKKQRDKKFADIEAMFSGDSDQIASTQSDWLAGRARHLMQSGDQANALADYDNAILQDPKNIRTIVSYSATLRQMGDVSRAKRIFNVVDDKQLIMDDPISLFRYYLEWGVVLIENGDDSAALKRLQRAIKVANQKSHIENYLKETREAKEAGLDIDLSSFDISDELGVVHELIAEINKIDDKNVTKSEKAKKSAQTKGSKLSIDEVSALFSEMFLENIDELRNILVEAIEKEGKLAVSRQKADVILFCSLLMYNILPLFNLFEEKVSSKVFKKICINIASAYESSAEELSKAVNAIREDYNASIVDNLRTMRASAWLLDSLLEDPNVLFYLQFDALLMDNSTFNWKVLSEEYEITT